jgi:hypothetical protein
MDQLKDAETFLKGEGWEFDRGAHIYRAGGRIIPGATEILKDAGFGYPPGNMEMGSAVHLATQYYDQNCLDPKSVTDDIYPYLLAWQKFRHEKKFKPDRIEQPNVNMALGFGATLDREGTWNEGKARVLIEIKKYAPTYFTGLQLALQDLTLPQVTLPRKRVAVELKSDGEFRIHRYDDSHEVGMALWLVSMYWYKKNKS